MKTLVFVVCSVLFFVGCHEVMSGKSEHAYKAKKDSLAIESALRQMSILEELGIDTLVLKQTYTVDKTINASPDLVNVRVEKKFDESRSIDLPLKYLEPVAVPHFNMFIPYYTIQIKTNERIVANDTVRSEDFWEGADSSLQAWGILHVAGIKTEKDSVEVEFDYVIPLTDVGKRVLAKYTFR
jgi:hypothetical protein